MDKSQPLSLSAYAIALKNYFKGKLHSQNFIYSRSANSSFQIPEHRVKSLEGKEESIKKNGTSYHNKSQYLTLQLNFSEDYFQLLVAFKVQIPCHPKCSTGLKTSLRVTIKGKKYKTSAVIFLFLSIWINKAYFLVYKIYIFFNSDNLKTKIHSKLMVSLDVINIKGVCKSKHILPNQNNK